MRHSYAGDMARYRLTGVSGGAVGISGGVQWEVVPSDRDIVVSVVDELEDRRMLWEAIPRSRSHHCVTSANEMRKSISAHLKTPGITPPLKTELKLLRRHFGDFMTHMSEAGLDVPGSENFELLKPELDWLQSVVGEQLGMLAAQYSIEVDEDLARIVPQQNNWFFGEFNS